MGVLMSNTEAVAAFIKAQSEMGKAVKKTDNPYHESKYADLETVLDAVTKPFNDNGFALMQLGGADETGKFVQGEYIVGLIAGIFLEKELGGTIVHDPRVIWNTKDIIKGFGGIAVQSKTGHAFIKQTMRRHEAIYGGEISAHHYFRDFAYCDSGMIPWVMVAQQVSKSGHSLEEWVKDRFAAFPSWGEVNFLVKDAGEAINAVVQPFRRAALSVDKTDGVSVSFEDWRFNLRRSNTEPLVRLNVESKGKSETLKEKVETIAKLLGGKRV